MEIQKVTDASFGVYGKVLTGYDLTEMLEVMSHTPCPADDVIYVPGMDELEAIPAAKELRERAYGGLPVQVGYCNGNNRKLNAVEYHRSSEIDIAQTDLVLLLGRQQDIEEDYTYDTSKIEAFYVPAGTAGGLYSTTPPFSPCTAEGGGFPGVILFPAENKRELDFTPLAEGEDRLITAKNKWLIAHEEAGIEGAFCGLKGENITLKES